MTFLFISAAMGYTAVSETTDRAMVEPNLEHRFNVEATGTDQSEQLNHISEVNVQKQENTVEITFSGAITGPNPCQLVEGNLNQSETGELELDITTVSNPETDMCATVMTSYNYDAELETVGVSKVTVLHDGEEMEIIEVDSDEKPGLFQRILSFFGF